MKKLSMLGIISGAALLTAVPFSLQWSQNNVILSLDSAEARIGNDPAQPPLTLAVQMVSVGTSFIRCLAELDAIQQC